MKRIAMLVTLVAILAMGDPAAAVDKSETRGYVVLMKLDPVARYKGDIQGYPATEPAEGNKISPSSATVKGYVELLEQTHHQALQAVGARVSDKVYDYTYALNGFAAQLSAAQAAELANQPGVLRVVPDTLRSLATDASPDFLGLTALAGPWTKGYNGTGVVVGIIDTGIWPEHPSFADDGSFGPAPVSLPDVADHPACDFGNTAWNPNDVPFTCNNKLIGARQYLTTYKLAIGLQPNEYDSARDDNSHGSHTASTAAGNANVEASILGMFKGVVSGMAPRAHVVAYKACAVRGCFTSDTAAAIDQAVADGVDVINYSIAGGASLSSPDALAFLFAADAGIFVAASAGNSGPGPGTVQVPASAPWVTAVGASTHHRAFISEITLSGPGAPPAGLWGASVTQGVSGFTLVDAEGIPDSTGSTSGQCLNPFPPGTFQPNAAVLCNQYNFGVARTTLGANVAAGGGGAVIIHNAAVVNVTPTDNHILPTVHMLNAVGQPLKDYLVAHPGQVTVSFTLGEAKYAPADPRVRPNVMASFSSRGQNPAAADIIKPDVTAPGMSILAGNTPTPTGTGAPHQLFQAIMGTSMSSPHVAGIFALLKQAHPDWSPATARSALMTTAYQGVLKEDFVTPADPFDMGAGHVFPGRVIRGSMFEPGLAYNASLLDYIGFLCDIDPNALADPGRTCALLRSMGIATEARNLNYPSIAVAELAGRQTVVRTLTSVAKESGQREYIVTVDPPPGYQVAVSPFRLRLSQGQSATYQVTITNVNAPIGEWRFGSLTWHERLQRYGVRSPIAVRAAP